MLADRTVKLTWNASPEPFIEEYNVYAVSGSKRCPYARPDVAVMYG